MAGPHREGQPSSSDRIEAGRDAPPHRMFETATDDCRPVDVFERRTAVDLDLQLRRDHLRLAAAVFRNADSSDPSTLLRLGVVENRADRDSADPLDETGGAIHVVARPAQTTIDDRSDLGAPYARRSPRCPQTRPAAELITDPTGQGPVVPTAWARRLLCVVDAGSA